MHVAEFTVLTRKHRAPAFEATKDATRRSSDPLHLREPGRSKVCAETCLPGAWEDLRYDGGPPGDDESRGDEAPDFDQLFLVRHGEVDTYRWFSPRLAARLWLALELLADEPHVDSDAYEDRLPPIALGRGPEFAAKISAAALELRDDIARGEPPYPRCTGESVVLGWALGDALDTASTGDPSTAAVAGRLVDPLILTDEDSADPASDLHGLYDSLFQDLDYEMLYSPALDGVDDSDHGRLLGMESLRPSDWFINYNNVGHLTTRPRRS